MTQQLSIGDLSKATDSKVETIRYYEHAGLLPKPPRTSGNYRSYEAGHLTRLGFIRRARELGLSLDRVRELLSLSDQKDRSCSQVDAIAREHLSEVDAKIASLKTLRRELIDIIRQCHSGTISECRIIDALGSKVRV